MYLLLHIGTWSAENYQDLATLSENIGVSTYKIKKAMNKSGKCFINQYLIQNINIIHTTRGGKTNGSFKPGHIRNKETSQSNYNDDKYYD